MIDIEEALVNYLTENSLTVCAPPLRDDFKDTLPFVFLQSTGGTIRQMVILESYLSFDIYGENDLTAHDTALKVVELLTALEGNLLADTQVYEVSVSALPAYNSDIDEPLLGRVTTNINISVRL